MIVLVCWSIELMCLLSQMFNNGNINQNTTVVVFQQLLPLK